MRRSRGSDMGEGPAVLSRVLRRDEVPEDGLAVTLEADAAARGELAALLGIPEVKSFAAELVVARWLRDGLVVRGRLRAEVVQTCVVTLQPFDNAVEDTVEDYYAPDPDAAAAAGSAVAAEEIEPLVGQRIDVGALAVEHLILGLDPHPRRPGVRFEPGEGGESDGGDGPFAALAALRGRKSGR